MRGRYEQNQGYSKSASALTSSAQQSHTVAPTSTRRLGKKLSVGILLTTLTILLITVGYAGYWNGGTGLIDHDTVSYTHLRAHETVLELVCRLLLEKKKNETTI